MIIGFSSGDFHKLCSDFKERLSHNFIDNFKANNKANAIEIHCKNNEQINNLIEENFDLTYFEYISIHMPKITYTSDKNTYKLLDRIKLITKKYDIKNIVFHADNVLDWSIFDQYKTLPISIENMDDRKDFWKSIEDLEPILNRYNLNLTLDLQHCFVNDNTLKLARDFHNTFRNKIVEYHISWFEQDNLHYTLFRTGQDEIINSLELKNTPIIIESWLDEIWDSQKEFEYIISRLNK